MGGYYMDEKEKEFREKCSGEITESDDKLVCKIDSIELEYDKDQGKTTLIKKDATREDIEKMLK